MPFGTSKVIAGDSWGRIAVPVIEFYPATAIIFCVWAKTRAEGQGPELGLKMIGHGGLTRQNAISWGKC